jgi:hypothetical protein
MLQREIGDTVHLYINFFIPLVSYIALLLQKILQLGPVEHNNTPESFFSLSLFELTIFIRKNLKCL